MVAEERTKEGPGEEMDEQQLLDQLLAETEGAIPQGLAEQIERDLGQSGQGSIARRLALAYLERPFSETFEQMRTDREFALAAANISEVLAGTEQRLDAVVQMLHSARTRLWVAVSAAREDSDEIFAEAKAEIAKAKKDDLHSARFAKRMKRHG